MSLFENIFGRKPREREPKGTYAVIDFTRESKEIGGDEREIIVVEDGVQQMVYPDMHCWRKILEDRRIPLVNVAESDLPYKEWEKSLKAAIDLGKIRFY